jgi:hypothetical protein
MESHTCRNKPVAFNLYIVSAWRQFFHKNIYLSLYDRLWDILPAPPQTLLVICFSESWVLRQWHAAPEEWIILT